METLISLQSEGLCSIGEPTVPRPSGVQQGSVVVVLDVNKGVTPGAVYWALGNVLRKGDHLKILGIITHLANPMGFMVRVDQSTRTAPGNIMELQYEIAAKKVALWKIAFMKEWCEKARVKLEVDVKAGNNPKGIATDEAKAMSAFHVVLDKNMKKDRKYFIDNLSCFVSRMRSSGGVDAVRSSAMSSKLPPMAPTTPKKGAPPINNADMAPTHQSKASMASTASSSSYRGGSSMSSTSFELGNYSSDDFSAQEPDPVSHPSSSDASDPQPALPPRLIIRTNQSQPPNQLYNLLRAGPQITPLDDDSNGFNNNPVRKPAVRKRPNEVVESQRLSVSETTSSSSADQAEGPMTPRTEFRFEQGPLSTARGGQRFRQQQQQPAGPAGAWTIGQLNTVAPEIAAGHRQMGRPGLAAALQTQASFNKGRWGAGSCFRSEKLSMDVHWPLMHWADCRAMRLRAQQHAGTSSSSAMLGGMVSSSSTGSLGTLRGRRRVPVSSGLNYSDMVDSD